MTSVLIENLTRLSARDKGLRHTLIAAARTPQIDLNAARIVYKYTARTEDSQDAGMITACCWAIFHRNFTGPVNRPNVNFGAALRGMSESDRERTFRSITTATRNSLREHLVSAAISLGAARSIPDWHMFHRDVFHMLHYQPARVLRRWATGLYHQPSTTTTTTAAAAATALEEITA